MLVLSRNVGQSVWIGEDVQVQVVRIAGNTIRLGITAPRDVPVYREELVEAGTVTMAKGVGPRSIMRENAELRRKVAELENLLGVKS